MGNNNFLAKKEIQRETGVTYKTAWRIFHQIRSILGEDIEKMDGEVEVDETYIGGRSRGKRGRRAYGKSIVAGIAQRNGKLAATKVPDAKTRTLIPMIQRRVSRKALVHTDEMASYNKLSYVGYNHRRVAHGAKLYVIGDAHTNTIDGFWSLCFGIITEMTKLRCSRLSWARSERSRFDIFLISLGLAKFLRQNLSVS